MLVQASVVAVSRTRHVGASPQGGCGQDAIRRHSRRGGSNPILTGWGMLTTVTLMLEVCRDRDAGSYAVLPEGGGYPITEGFSVRAWVVALTALRGSSRDDMQCLGGVILHGSRVCLPDGDMHSLELWGSLQPKQPGRTTRCRLPSTWGDDTLLHMYL